MNQFYGKTAFPAIFMSIKKKEKPPAFFYRPSQAQVNIELPTADQVNIDIPA
jgi:hypothetical protein